jgi:DNA-binding NarL/FixJ family response regulator
MTPDSNHRCRLVLCDDAADFVALVRLVLSGEEDIEIVGEAYNGAQAITMCAELQPELLVLDVSMPVMDGLTALPKILDASPETRVVMLSGFASDEVKQQAQELGAVRFIEKGVSPQELLSQLRSEFRAADCDDSS